MFYTCICLLLFSKGGNFICDCLLSILLFVQKIQVAAARLFSLLFVVGDASKSSAFANAFLGLDDKQVFKLIKTLTLDSLLAQNHNLFDDLFNSDSVSSSDRFPSLEILFTISFLSI